MYKKVYYITNIIIILVCLFFVTMFISVNIQDRKVIKTRKNIIFQVDSSFTSIEKVAIKNALNMWTKKSLGLINLKFTTKEISFFDMFSFLEDNSPTIYNASSFYYWPRYVSQYFTALDNLIGSTFCDTGDIFIINRDPEKFKIIVAHEVGHVLLGLFHSKNKISIMYPEFGYNRKITMEEFLLLNEQIEKEK